MVIYVAAEKCVTVAVEKKKKKSPVTVEHSPDETDMGKTISIGPPLQKEAPCMEEL